MQLLRNFAFVITLFVTLICYLILSSRALDFSELDLGEGLFWLPFTLSPLILSLGISAFSSGFSTRLIITIGTVIYAIWFIISYYNAFFWNHDAQSADALMTVGLYSLPVMVPVWIAALFFRKSNKKVSGVEHAPGEDKPE